MSLFSCCCPFFLFLLRYRGFCYISNVLNTDICCLIHTCSVPIELRKWNNFWKHCNFIFCRGNMSWETFSVLSFFFFLSSFFPLSPLSVLENTNDYCATDRSKRKTLSGMIPKASVSEEEGGEKAVAVTVVVERHIWCLHQLLLLKVF